MKRRDTRKRVAPVRQPGREGLRGLLGRPWVQAVLLVTAVGQVVGTSIGGEAQAPVAGRAEVVARLAPAVVVPEETGEIAAWKERAVARESERLAAEYREDGYRISEDLAREILAAAMEHEIDPEVAFGLVKAESSFRNSATSYVGAVGLTQLMPRTAAWMEPGTTRRDLRDPETNLRIGFKYLRYLLDKYGGDRRLALLAYNRGPGTVDRVLRRGGDPDNGYVEMVLGN